MIGKGKTYKYVYLIRNGNEFKHCQEYLFSNGCSWNVYSVDDICMPWNNRYDDVGLYLIVSNDNKMFFQGADSNLDYSCLSDKNLSPINYGKMLREDKLKRILGIRQGQNDLTT